MGGISIPKKVETLNNDESNRLNSLESGASLAFVCD